jgi:hypothetical protein
MKASDQLHAAVALSQAQKEPLYSLDRSLWVGPRAGRDNRRNVYLMSIRHTAAYWPGQISRLLDPDISKR